MDAEPRESILVADDEPAVLDVCTRVLQRLGYQVTGVDSGSEALARLKEQPFDLLLTDIKMPDINGLDVLSKVKETNPDLPVVLITGFGSLETAIHAIRLGAEGLLLKPFHAEDLRKAVEAALSRTRLWRENLRLKILLPLLEATRALMSETDPNRLYQIIVRIAVNLVHADRAWLLLSKLDDTLAQAACTGVAEHDFPEPLLSTLSDVFTSDKPFVLSASPSEHPGRRVGQSLHLSDMIVLPVMLHEKSVGYLIIGRSEEHVSSRSGMLFEEGELEALSLFMQQAAVAIENAQLFQQVRAYAEHLEEMVEERTRELRESEAHVRRLYEASRQLRSTLDFEQVIADVLALAISIAGAEQGTLIAFGESGQVHEVIRQGGIRSTALESNNTLLRAEEEILEAEIISRILTQRGTLLIADLEREEGLGPHTSKGSVLGVPLLQADEVLAILILRHRSINQFMPEHVNLLMPICSQAAAVLANARLFQETSLRLNRAYTEIQERAKQLEMTTQQLVRSEKLALMGQLAAGIAHEMGNIIAPLRVYADLLANASQGDHESATYVRQIQAITERAGQILRQFTDFARKDSGQRQNVSVCDLIDRTLNLLDFFLRRNKVNIYRNYSPDLPTVHADPGQLEQVFANIVVNAIDAMPNGGDLRITARVGQQTSGESQYLEILFSDTGCGIAPENLERVFEPFFTTKEPGKGTGLGLFISYGIIERHGGSMDIESKLGKGTTLKIRLPIPDAKGIKEEGLS